jgi:hypothetical protein
MAMAMAMPLGLLGAQPAAAKGFDELLAVVPAEAGTVVAVDHARLASHTHYKDILGLLGAQGWGKSLQPAMAVAEAGKGLARSITFRAGGGEGSVVAGAVDAAALRKHFEGKLGAVFAAGDLGGKAWFTVGKEFKALDLGGGRLAIGSLKTLGRVLAVLDGQAKGVAKKGYFSTLSQEASASNAPLWAVGYLSKRARARLDKSGAKDMAQVERATLAIRGAGDLTLSMIGHTAAPDKAQQVAAAVNSKIQRKVMSNALLKALGVAALASRLTVSAKGKKVVGDMPLTEAQVGLIARYGGKIMAVLK